MGATPEVTVAEVSGSLDLARLVLEAAIRRGRTLATAESCTGGLVSATLTAIPGASAAVAGGVVAYSDDAKIALLRVPAETLAAHGAVSAQVARAMAMGARARLGADLAVAVTGISGPSGGTPAKPVGLTYIAVADAAGIDVERHLWAGDRTANRAETVRAALELLLRWLEEADR